MTPIVKICGLQDAEILCAALQSPIDIIGFVFAASRRRVSPEQAAAMIEAAKRRGGRLPRFAGVFVDPDADELQRVLRIAPLDIVQLHGREDADFCAWVRQTFGVGVFKAFSIREHDSDTQLPSELDRFAGAIDALMLDTAGGGSGRTFRWEAIPPFRDWTRARGIPLLIAGGLHADNVRELIERYEPDGVDVSSGVETDGVKDVAKIHTFVGRVKSS
jgi:phosphoribosylanthranilate isomerase